MSGRTGSGLIFHLSHLSVNTVSTDLDQFNVKLLARDHVVILSSLADLESTFDASMITYVSSAYLHNLLPLVRATRSAAVTTYDSLYGIIIAV